MINYDVFWKTLKKRGISQYALIHKHKISPSILDRMKKNEYISLRKAIDFCEILNCDLSDIVRYVPKNTRHINK